MKTTRKIPARFLKKVEILFSPPDPQGKKMLFLRRPTSASGISDHFLLISVVQVFLAPGWRTFLQQV
jgi:hypothetical protein